MATELRIRRGTTAENDAFTGAEGELTFDTERKELRIHDGETEGGIVVAMTNAGQPAEFSEMPEVDGNPIVARGSNSDGEFTVWADGTLIQTVSDTRNIDTNDNATLGGGRYLVSNTLDWPMPFLGGGDPNGGSIQNNDSAMYSNMRFFGGGWRFAAFTNNPSDRGSVTHTGVVKGRAF